MGEGRPHRSVGEQPVSTGSLDDLDTRLTQTRESVVARMRCLTGDRREAEELAQDAVGEAFVARDRYRGDHGCDRAVLGWVLGIARNMRNDRLRSGEYVGRWAPDALDELGSWGRSAESDASVDLLCAALERLRPDQAGLLRRHHLEGVSVEELARTLDASQGAVKQRLYRARRDLAAMMRCLDRSRHRLPFP